MRKVEPSLCSGSYCFCMYRSNNFYKAQNQGGDSLRCLSCEVATSVYFGVLLTYTSARLIHLPCYLDLLRKKFVSTCSY